MTISAACASTGWAVNGAVSNGRSIAHFPIEAQREVWGGDADPFTCACFAPTGTAVPVDGGYVLSGTWSFASGCDHASWVYLGAFITPPDAKPAPDRGPGQALEGAFFLLPIGDCEIVDNWFVCGLAGTGSKDIVVREMFVPAHRVLLFADARAGTAPGAKYHQNPLYRMPLLIHGASMLASTAVGAARGALDTYLEMTTGAQDPRRARRRSAADGRVRDDPAALRRGGRGGRERRADPADRHAQHDAEALCGRGDHGRRPHPLPPQSGLGHQARGAGGRCAQRLDRRLWPASRATRCSAPGATPTRWRAMSASIGTRSARCTASTPLVSSRAASISLYRSGTTPTEGTGRWRKYSVSASPTGRPCACRTRG